MNNKYFNFNVTFKVSKDDNFSEVITLTPNVDNQIKLFLNIENEFSFPDTQDLPNIKKFNRLLQYDFDNKDGNPPYLSLKYKNNEVHLDKYKSNGSDFCFYNGSDIIGKIEVYNITETDKFDVTDVFDTDPQKPTPDDYCKIWLKEGLWKEEDEAELERFNKTYNFVVYFIDQESNLFAEKDVRIPSIYRPFYMQNYIILSRKCLNYMFNINNAVGLKDENGNYIIGDVETSIQVNYEENDEDKEYKRDFKYPYLSLSNISSLLFQNYNYNKNLSRQFDNDKVIETYKTITLKYKIQFKEKEPTFSHPDFLINSVYEENNLSFYGIEYFVKSIEIDKNQYAAQIYINKVNGTSSNGIRYFVTNMEFAKLVNDVTAITVPSEEYDLYPSKIRGKEEYTEYGSKKFYYGGVYSFHKIFKTAQDDASIDRQISSNRYAYELKNLYEYTEQSTNTEQGTNGYYILTYKAPDGTEEKDITKANFHIVAIYDPVTLLSDDDMIQEQLYSKILKPHNNFTSIMRIY